MRIAHIITRFIRGGADENTQLTCNYQAQKGYSVTLIVGQQLEMEMRERLDPRIHLIVLTTLVRRVSPFLDLQALWHLYTILHRLKPDLVHTHTSKAGALGRIAARLASVPTIVHGVHILPFTNETFFRRVSYIGIEKICGLFTNAFVHVSAAMLEECTKRKIGNRAIHIVAESGMDVDRFREKRYPDDAAFLLTSPMGSTDRPFVILSLAALEHRKGQRRFLKVFRKIVDQRENVVLLLAGDGNQRREIEADVQEMGLSSHVQILGYRDDPERLLSIADILVICSDREGLPRAAVQSALAGVPIVSTALPGIDAVVYHNERGFVVPIGDAKGMETCILRLIDDPLLRHRMHAHLSSADFSAWAIESMVEKIESVYLSVLQNKPRETSIATPVP